MTNPFVRRRGVRRNVPKVDTAQTPPDATAPHEQPKDIRDALERMSPADVLAFGDALREAEERAKTKTPEDALPEEDVDALGVRADIEQLEDECERAVAAVAAIAAKTRVQIAEVGLRAVEAMRKGLALLDLDTKEKAYAALLELIPFIALTYAAIGARVAFREGKGIREPYLEDIDAVDRALYAAGSVFFLGHVWSGIRHALVKKGLLDVARKLLVPSATHGKRLLIRRVTRAKQKMTRTTKDTSKT